MVTLWLVVPGAVAGLGAVVLLLASIRRHRRILSAGVLGSISALLLVTGWLLTDSAVPKTEALRTGGFAGGAVLALHALWINDRRRRTEEDRQDVERARAELDRERVSDERFAKSVELLGNDADQVRVGALYALAGLARSRPAYTPTVLELLCGYLRRPFVHPAYELRPDDPDQAEVNPTDTWSAEQIAVADRERQVRIAAHRLIADLLPDAGDPEALAYDLDLSAANLEYLDLAGRFVGRLTVRRARLHGANRLSGTRVQGPALFSDAVFHGRTDCFGAHFDGGLSLMRAQVRGLWRVPTATARVFGDFRAAAPEQQVGVLTLLGDARLKLGEDTGWAIHVEQPATAGDHRDDEQSEVADRPIR